jgi:hypothetical protein
MMQSERLCRAALYARVSSDLATFALDDVPRVGAPDQSAEHFCSACASQVTVIGPRI